MARGPKKNLSITDSLLLESKLLSALIKRHRELIHKLASEHPELDKGKISKLIGSNEEFDAERASKPGPKNDKSSHKLAKLIEDLSEKDQSTILTLVKSMSKTDTVKPSRGRPKGSGKRGRPKKSELNSVVEDESTEQV